MFFFDDFIKKINKKEIVEKKIRKYRVELRKMIMFLGTGIPLILIGGFQSYIGYMGIEGKKNFIEIGIGLIFIFLGLKSLKTMTDYKIILDEKKEKLYGQGIDLNFKDIDLCELKEGIAGRGRIQIILRIVTKDKKEIIIPLMMNKRIEFVAVLRKNLDKKFHIIK